MVVLLHSKISWAAQRHFPLPLRRVAHTCKAPVMDHTGPGGVLRISVQVPSDTLANPNRSKDWLGTSSGENSDDGRYGTWRYLFCSETALKNSHGG
jgi:hypothetical protein